MDLYDIEFIRGKKTETVNGIYFDEMVDVIDKRVEYIPAYKDWNNFQKFTYNIGVNRPLHLFICIT